jgi:hypothetical protein
MSLQAQHDPKNEAEINYWNSAGGRHWIERQPTQAIILGPILQATLERAQREGRSSQAPLVDLKILPLEEPCFFDKIVLFYLRNTKILLP